jgi:hypothetical protein
VLLQEVYGVDEVLFVDELSSSFKKLAPPKVYVSHGVNTDSDAHSTPAAFDGLEVYLTPFLSVVSVYYVHLIVMHCVQQQSISTPLAITHSCVENNSFESAWILLLWLLLYDATTLPTELVLLLLLLLLLF